MNRYIIHSPSTYELMDLIQAIRSPIDLIHSLSAHGMSTSMNDLSRGELLSLLALNQERLKPGFELISGPDSCSQQYIAEQVANQLDEIDPHSEVILTNSAYTPLTNFAQGSKGVFITSMSSNFPTTVVETILLNTAKIPVILGGIHISACPEDVDTYIRRFAPHPHLISRVIGPGDATVIRAVLDDLRQDSLKPEYRGFVTIQNGMWGNPRIRPSMHSKKSLFERIPYIGSLHYGLTHVKAVAPFIGCQFSCDFCSISGIDPSHRRFAIRDPEDLVAELRWLEQNGTRTFAFVTDNLLSANNKLDAMLERMTTSDLRMNYVAQVSIEVADRPELLTKLRDSGATTLYLGLESLNLDNLRHIRKPCVARIERSGLSVREYYAQKIKKIQKHGLSITAAFMVGLPHDYFHNPLDHSGRDIARFCREHHIMLQCTTLTDLPGSKQHDRSISEGTHLYGSPGSMDYLLSLCLTDLFWCNRIPPSSLLRSPLVVSYMAYDARMMVLAPTNILSSAVRMAYDAFKQPVHNRSRRIADRIFYDPLFACGQQLLIMRSLLCRSLIKQSHRIKRSLFRRLYDQETDFQTKKLFKNTMRKFKKT